MKYFFVTIVVAIAALVYYTFYYRPLSAQSPTTVGEIILGNLPDEVCPEKAWLLAAQINSNKSVIDRVVPVQDCRKIALRNYLPTYPGEFNVYLKLPFALAVSVAVNTPLQQTINLPIQLGDITNDNVIDDTDEKTVTENLYSTDSISDLTGDGKVSVEDVVLLRLNKGVGVERFDKKSWSRIQ